MFFRNQASTWAGSEASLGEGSEWRFLDGVCYDGNRIGSHYYRMDGLAGFEYGVE